ncbi:MAG: hypothetical protein ACKOZN_03435 [Cyanobium sp.]
MPPLPRWLPLLAAGLQLLIGGVRFSDGRILLAISQGQGLEAAIFRNPATHYIWESPLKVLLLRAWPLASLLGLACLFLLLGLLPLIGLLWPRGSRFYALTSWLLVLTPALKVSLQHLGVGDGLVSLLTVLLVLQRRHPATAAGLVLLIATWHPGQALFIAVSTLVGMMAVGEAQPLRRLWPLATAMVGALLAGRLVLLLHNHSLGFAYTGRFGYLKLRFAEFLPGNLLHAPLGLLFPIALCLACLGLIRLPQHRLGCSLVLAWCAVVSAVAVFTTDVSRVAVLCLSPLPLILVDSPDSITFTGPWHWPWLRRHGPLLCGLATAVIPLYSWSGIDLSLWPDLFHDACKYGIFCS